MMIHDLDSPYLYEPVQELPAKKRKLSLPDPLKGLFVFFVMMVAFSLLGGELVYYFGMYGNALTEILVFGVGSVMAVAAFVWTQKDVFPLKKPTVTGVLAALLLWYAAYRLMTLEFGFVTLLFPQQVSELESSMESYSYGLNMWEELLVTALVPAITEEMLHRGFLQYSLRRAKRNWIVYLLMGIYFGIFHMSGIRFLPMMTMGIVLAYVRQKTGNMVYPMLMHFVNNAVSVVYPYLYVFLYGAATAAAASDAGSLGSDVMSLGHYLIQTAIVPFTFWCGSYLLTYEKQNPKLGIFGGAKHPRLVQVVLIVLTAICVVFGGLLMMIGMVME